MARQRREEILPQQPAAADLAAAAGRHRQGALVLRAGAPAAQAGARARRLRRPLLDRPASARVDDLHRLCLSATPAPEGCGAGEKRWAATDRRRSRRCLRSAAPSSPSCSLRLRFLIVAPTATGGFFNTLPKCQGSVNLARQDLSAFRQRCGDKYMGGMVTGGQFLADIVTETTSIADKTTIAATLG